MQNLKYLERVVDEEDRFGIVLTKIAMRHEGHVQLKIALSLLEYFNHGKYVQENDIQKNENIFFIPKPKYFPLENIPESKVFSIRINIDAPKEEIDKKIAKMKHDIDEYQLNKLI